MTVTQISQEFERIFMVGGILQKIHCRIWEDC